MIAEKMIRGLCIPHDITYFLCRSNAASAVYRSRNPALYDAGPGRDGSSDFFFVFRFDVSAFGHDIEKQILLLPITWKQRPDAIGHFRVRIQEVFFRQIPSGASVMDCLQRARANDQCGFITFPRLRDFGLFRLSIIPTGNQGIITSLQLAHFFDLRLSREPRDGIGSIGKQNKCVA